MQLNVTTDYAIRSLLYIAIQNKPVTSPDIANVMVIPPNYLITIMAKLKKAGIVSVLRGKEGGYYLAKKPEEISLLDIINVMEGTTRINRCLEKDKYCSRFASESCPVRSVYVAMQNCIEDGFRKVTLATLKEMIKDNSQILFLYQKGSEL